MTFARIPRSATAATIRPSGDGAGGDTGRRTGAGERSTLARPGSQLTEPLLDRIGLRVLDAGEGRLELARTDYVANSFGTINGGVVGMAVQGAAEAVCAATGARLVATDVQLHYLAQMKEGPLRTHTRVLRVGGEAVDAGRDGVVIAMAAVTLQRR
jgi:acyl-coenzyme A thioesterase PaaI-like protein